MKVAELEHHPDRPPDRLDVPVHRNLDVDDILMLVQAALLKSASRPASERNRVKCVDFELASERNR